MSSKIKDFGEKALYKTGEILSILTPFVPGDLQVKIGEHSPEKGEFGDYYYSGERTAADYTLWSTIAEVAEIGLPIAAKMSAIGPAQTFAMGIPSLEILVAGAYLAGDFVYRFKNYAKGEPSATAVIEIPYRLVKKTLQKNYKGKNKTPAVL